MRITNSMTTNTLLLNLQKNMRLLDKYQYQAYTGKKIQYPSDNPIIASRALKFRTNVSETEQYIRNVDQAISWTETSKEPIANVLSLLYTGDNSIRAKIELAASGTYTSEDRQKLVAEIKELLAGFSGEANATYAGRYVFSGFRTNEPVFFLKNEPDKEFEITQKFTAANAEKTTVYFKDPTDAAAMPVEKTVYRIMIPYTEGVTINSPAGIVTKSLYADTDCYDPADGAPHFIQETGEIVMSEADYNAWKSGGASVLEDVTYTKTGFKENDINPVVYFDCKDLVTGKEYSMTDAAGNSTQQLKYEFSTNTQLQINTLGKDFLTPEMLNDINDIIRLIENYSPSDKDALYTKYSGPPYNYTGSELDKAVSQQLDDEEKLFKGIMGDRLTKLLGKIDKHAEVISKENTTLGARMNRLDLIENRLQENKINYETLKTNNEAADVDEVLIHLSAQLSVYTAALQIGSNISLLTLANFIQ